MQKVPGRWEEPPLGSADIYEMPLKESGGKGNSREREKSLRSLLPGHQLCLLSDPELCEEQSQASVGSLAKRTGEEKTIRGEKLLVQLVRQPRGNQLRLWQDLLARCHPADSSSTFTSDVQLALVLLWEGSSRPSAWDLAPLTVLQGTKTRTLTVPDLGTGRGRRGAGTAELPSPVGGRGAAAGIGDPVWGRGDLSLLRRRTPGKGTAQRRCTKIAASKTLFPEKTSLSFITATSESGSGLRGSWWEGGPVVGRRFSAPV